jgi:hypothetical protein
MRRRGAPAQKTKALSAGRVWRYAWFDRVGYTVDRAALRREFPDVAFHDFESWAKAQGLEHAAASNSRRGIPNYFHRGIDVHTLEIYHEAMRN